MACTIDTDTVKTVNLAAGFKIVTFEFSFDASYAAGGEVLDVSSYFASAVLHCSIGNTDTAADALVVPRYVKASAGAPATGKVVASWDPADGAAAELLADVTATTDLSGYVFSAFLFGTDA